LYRLTRYAINFIEVFISFWRFTLRCRSINVGYGSHQGALKQSSSVQRHSVKIFIVLFLSGERGTVDIFVQSLFRACFFGLR